MEFNIVEESNIFLEDGSTLPPFKVIDEDGNEIFSATTLNECEVYINNINT